MAVDPAVLEQMMTAEEAPEPGTWSIRDVIHRGDDEVPAPIVASALQSAGYTYLYDTKTGERSLTNNNMLHAQLSKKREDGSRVFSTVPPTANGRIVKPKRGTLKCLLHADDSQREHYDELGLPTCPKANLTSKHQVMLHMRHRHKMEWETIEQERQEAEKAADRAFQRSIVTMAGKNKG